MNKPKVVIWGASGHGLVVGDILQLTGEYTIVGFLDSINLERKGESFSGGRILGGIELLDTLHYDGVTHIIFGIGDCLARLRLADIVKIKGYELATAIHPNSIIAKDVTIGAGTVIAAGAVINPGVRIGENVIINTMSSVDHNSVILDGVHISPGVHVAGNVNVGRGTWVGIGSAIIDHICVGASSIIGAGSVIVNDVPDNVVVFGVPGKIHKVLRPGNGE